MDNNFEVTLWLFNFSKVEALSEILKDKFQLSVRKCDDGWVAFYLSGDVGRCESDKIIEELLDILYDLNLQNTKGCINVAVYCYTAMVSYCISPDIMSRIAGIGFEFEITVYPCSKD